MVLLFGICVYKSSPELNLSFPKLWGLSSLPFSAFNCTQISALSLAYTQCIPDK
jgi:hypothetical protein